MVMKVRRIKKDSVLIIWIIFGIMVLGMVVLLVNLWTLQVPKKGSFEDEFIHQSVRRVRLPALRGKIYDSQGVCLADSVPNYCIAIYTEELRAPRSAVANTLELIHEIWSRIGRKPDISYKEIKQHFLIAPNKPLVAWKNLDDQTLATWNQKYEAWYKSRNNKKIKGLDTPTQNRNIVLNTKALKKKSTSTAANVLELVYKISDRIQRPRNITFQQIKDHIYDQRPLPLLAWKHISTELLAKWGDTCSDLIGTDIYCMPARTYPDGENFAHLIGLALPANAVREEDGTRYHFDLGGIDGKKGLESTYDKLLQGKAGSKLVQVDVSGFHYKDLQTKPPKFGGDLKLTIDANIQRFAKEALTMHVSSDPFKGPVKGAVVVLNPNNGDVLAMVSAPSFDPNAFMNSKSYRQSMLTNTTQRAFNRAVFGQYPPGSTFKPIAALGVLKEYPDFAYTNYVCNGFIHVGRRKMKCWAWRSGGHGDINLRQALMHSCNVYMFKMAQQVGYQPIHDMAKDFGIGQFAGLFPDLEAKPVHLLKPYGNLPEKALNTTDLCNLSIGQGRITASPLQMAMVAATIANGGTLYRPRLIKEWRISPNEKYRKNPTWAIRRIDIPMPALELVRGGMYDVVMDPHGTAKKARVKGIKIAGKTGSAQYRKRINGEVKTRVHTWMISYAPFDFPRYAVAMLVEDGKSGGSTVGPRLSALYKNLFKYDGTLSRGDLR